jgi:hypothetical protein
LEIYARYAIIQWTPRCDTLLGSSQGLNLTNLEYDIEIAALPFQYTTSSPLKKVRHQQDIIAAAGSDDIAGLPLISDYLGTGSSVSDAKDLASNAMLQYRPDEQLVWTKADTRPYRMANNVFDSVSPSPYMSVDRSDDVSIASDAQLGDPGLGRTTSASTMGGGSQEAEVVSVLMDRLSASTSYLVRVRARTVAGWSRWSEVSQEFKTIDAS